jgi:hypothetical protein
MEDALEKFAIFGGVGWGKMDTSKTNYDLIEEFILQDYGYIRNDITDLTTGLPLYHSILSAIALSDGKVHAVYKRANVTTEVGDKAIEDLVERGIIKILKSPKTFTSWSEREAIDNRLYFTTPFLRFWFAFVSPLFKGIRDGDFKEVAQRWQNREKEFIAHTFTALTQEMLQAQPYFDRDVEFDLYKKTKDGVLIGSCKYTDTKVKKSEKNRLEELAEKAGIDASHFVIVAKKGFSSELKALKSPELQLLTLKSLKALTT